MIFIQHWPVRKLPPKSVCQAGGDRSHIAGNGAGGCHGSLGKEPLEVQQFSMWSINHGNWALKSRWPGVERGSVDGSVTQFCPEGS